MAIDNIDLLEFRHNVMSHLYVVADNTMSVIHTMDSMDVAIGLSAMIAILGVYEWHRRWVKGRGLRMAVKREEQRVREWLSEGLTDLILQGEVDGKISHQEGDKLYNELSKKLDLPDLIPRQRRFKIVKNEIKTRLKSTEPEAELARKKVHIPGGMPEVVVRKKFRQSAGGLIQKFWKTV